MLAGILSIFILSIGHSTIHMNTLLETDIEPMLVTAKVHHKFAEKCIRYSFSKP